MPFRFRGLLTGVSKSDSSSDTKYSCSESELSLLIDDCLSSILSGLRFFAPDFACDCLTAETVFFVEQFLLLHGCGSVLELLLVSISDLSSSICLFCRTR